MTRILILLHAIVAVGLTMVATASAAQETSTGKPIRIIYPYTAGGSATVLAQLLVEQLTKLRGQPAIAEARPGGNTIIGSQAVAGAAPDGHTLLLQNSAHVINPSLLKTPYDTVKDFVPVATLVSTDYLVTINPELPVNSLQELIALAKAKPGTLNYGSTGNGSVTHLLAELFNITAGVKTTHIPYKGSAHAMTDLAGGQIQMYFSPPDVAASLVKSGKLRALAITGKQRFAELPQVPTFAEAGLPSFNVAIWFGIFAPRDTPRPVVEKLSADIARILTLPDVQANLWSRGFTPFVSTPEQFAELVKTDLAPFANVIKTAGIRAN
ncbi:MAG: tripartite tricarboxylate transporter substrate binding protein [Burkholderiaceae bacterium]